MNIQFHPNVPVTLQKSKMNKGQTEGISPFVYSKSNTAKILNISFGTP